MKSDIRGFILLVIVCALFYWLSPVRAADFESTVGHASWTRSDNGTWWETPFPEKWPASTQTWSIGMTDRISTNLPGNIKSKKIF